MDAMSIANYRQLDRSYPAAILISPFPILAALAACIIKCQCRNRIQIPIDCLFKLQTARIDWDYLIIDQQFSF
jgi:hypothetical protein